MLLPIQGQLFFLIGSFEISTTLIEKNDNFFSILDKGVDP